MNLPAPSFPADQGSQFLNLNFQSALAGWNRRRLQPGFPADDWHKLLDDDRRMQRLEGAFLEELRSEVADRAAEAPESAAEFVRWFEELK